jgi:tetratricopeptide (TPR) repeat protein
MLPRYAGKFSKGAAQRAAPDAAAEATAVPPRAPEAQRKHEPAIAAARKAVEESPGDPALHYALGDLLRTAGKPETAIASYRRAIELKPDYALAHNHLGIALAATGRNEEAIRSYRRAIELNPREVRPHNNLGTALLALSRFDEAIGSYEEAARLAPASATVQFNLATARRAGFRLEESLKAYERAIELAPENAAYRWNYGLTLLMMGRYASGWQENELRWQANPHWARRYRAKPWAGELKPGGKLLVWGEQGIGDEVIYAALFAELVSAGLKVTLETDSRLVALMRRSFPALRVVSRRNPPALDLAQFDWQCPLGSLPRWLRPTAASFPRHSGFLKPDPARAAAFAQQLRAPGAALVVGISWKSANQEFGAFKSTAFSDWEPILGVPGVRFVDLQYGDTREFREAARRAGREITHLDGLDLYRDIEGLAALCAACDLVITASNVTAHIAGALGKPVWLLARRGPGRIWYWLAGSNESQWYPSMRIYSQEKLNDWLTVTRAVAQVLAERVGNPGKPLSDPPVMTADRASPRPAAEAPGKPRTVSRDEAIALLKKAIARAPSDANLHRQLGHILRDRGSLDEAIAAYRKATSLNPGDAAAHNDLGLALYRAERNEEAVQSYRRAVELDPGSADAHHRLGSALLRLELIDEAIASCAKATQLDPKMAAAHAHLGNCYGAALKLNEALASYRRALALEPGAARYRWNHAIWLLMDGNYVDGWREYQCRWEGASDAKGHKPPFKQPEWAGQDIAGKTILLFREQGYGDVIQFVRFAPMVAARGAKVILAVQPALVPLLKGVKGVSAVVSHTGPLPRFDLWCSLMALPHLFLTTLATIPARVPYIPPDPKLSAGWRKRIGSTKRLKVGLIWGSDSRNRIRGRAVTLGGFAPLAKLEGVNFYSLQLGECAKEAKSPPAGMSLTDWTGDIKSFADTAALMENLDLIISVDTGPAHLAGAIGKPVWLLSRFQGEWRWLTGREDSPWYPTMRIFRQPRPGDWKAVMEKVAAALAELLPGAPDAPCSGEAGSGARPAPAVDVNTAKREADAAFRARDFARAAELLRRIVEASPTPARYADLAEMLRAQDRKEEAIAAYGKAVELAPGDTRFLLSLGHLLHQAGEPERALDHYRHAVAHDPNLAPAYAGLARAFFALRKFDEAIASARRALELNPLDAGMLRTVGDAHLALHRHADAIAPLEQAAQIDPSSHLGHYLLGSACQGLGRLGEAIAAYERAIAIAPEVALYHFNYSIALLHAGDYARGWREYERRWDGSPEIKTRRTFPQPVWEGEDIAGKTILLHCEQGLGDTLQFIRYAPLVAARGARVVVRCQTLLERLFKSGVEGISAAVGGKKPLPPFDTYRMMLSLPLVFGTTVDTIPARVPYIKADPALAGAWRKRIGSTQALKVGLVWGSDSKNRVRGRDCPLVNFAPMAKLAEVRFYSMQFGAPAAQAKSPPPGMKLTDWTGDIADFADTAALMENLDLVISVCTASAHLAGAMGKPTWLLLRHQGDWRWLREREDSPWYPTLRIFRQPSPGDWRPVMEQAAAALAALRDGRT